MKTFQINPIGVIHSPYKKREDMSAPFGLDKSKKFVLEIFDEYLEGAEDIEISKHYDILFVFDQINEYVFKQHPRGNTNLRKRGVFSIRSPRRPNFIGLTQIEVADFDGKNITFFGGDMLDGTPVVDIKPSLQEINFKD